MAAMLHRRSTAAIEAAVIGIVVMACLASGAGLSPVLNGDEARFAQASREMLLNHDWVVPTFGGQPRYDKPILIYWATATSFKAFGTTPWAARLPSAVAAALCAALLAWSAHRRWGPGAGLFAGLFLAASPIFFFEGRTCTADALNLLWTMMAMLALEQLLTGRPNRKATAVFWLSTGLAVLTKGPVAPFFIGSTLIGLWALRRRWNVLQRVFAGVLVAAGALKMGPAVLIVPAVAALFSFLKHQENRTRLAAFRWHWGLPLFLALTLPWAILAWRATSGEYFAVAIGRHVLARGQTALEGHSGFPGFFAATAVILCFPWLATALRAAADVWRNRRGLPDTLFFLAWALGPLVALETVHTKLVHYWLPSYPALILLAVGWLWTTADRRFGRGFGILHLIGGCLLAVIPILPVLLFDLPELEMSALALSLLLVVTTVSTAFRLGRLSGVSAAATLLFLSLLFGPFLSSFSRSFLGTRATAEADELLGRGLHVSMYGLRDEEMLFSLPAETEIFKTPRQLETTSTRRRTSVYCAREKDYLRIPRTEGENRFEVVKRVEGIDLGRGREAATVFFRRIETGEER